MQEWLPRGVVYTLRSVREARVASVAHFTVYSILPRGCFSACLLAKAVEGREQQTGRCEHPRFLYVVKPDREQSAGCQGQLLETNKETD